MNYYPFHIGDYVAHTAHLEPMEDLAYRRLLDQYYIRECPLPSDVQATAKLIRMRSMADDVESVLREFFTLTDEGWVHSRCEVEIEKFQDKRAKARASAQASVNARKAGQLNDRSTDAEVSASERSTNAEKNQTDVELPKPEPKPEPIPNKELKEDAAEAAAPGKPSRSRFNPLEVELPDSVSSGAWSEWIAYRRQEGMSVKQVCLESQLRSLQQWHSEGQDPNEIIRTAIRASWKSLWPDKTAKARASPGFGGLPDKSAERKERIARLAAQAGDSREAVNA